MKLDANIHVTMSVVATKKVLQGSEVKGQYLDHTEYCNGEGHYSIR